nr:glycoside hydrolase family 13 protein [uncultured Undibacterium sp.]
MQRRLFSPRLHKLLTPLSSLLGGAVFFSAIVLIAGIPGLAFGSETTSAPPQNSTHDIQHVEPSSWWIGMKHPDLQLMVHGKNISELTPHIDYRGVSIRKIQHSDNANYLFIDLHIAANSIAGTINIIFKRGEKTVLTQKFSLENRRPHSASRAGFTPGDAIYLVVPDRFANGDRSNDSHSNYSDKLARDVAGGRHGGDIQGMQQHLNYIANMGFTMLWPTPLMENAMPMNSYHGYAATDFYKIDPRFGSNASYKELVASAKQKGVGMIQDIVLNHIGSNHWWMKDLPSSDWLNFPKKYTETNHIRSTLQDIHASQIDKQKFTDGWFVKTMPDMNQRNPFLANYLIQNTLWWIEYADLSGLRVDTYSYSDKDFLARWSQTITDEYPNLNIVGEEWSMNPSIVAYWQRKGENKPNHDGYRSSMPSMMDFSVYQALHTSLVGEHGKPADMMTMYDAIANDFIYPQPDKLTIFEGNHDTPRIFSALNQDVALNKLAMVMLATLRGIPQMFYGAEILMTSPTQRDDGKVRGDFPGGWTGDKINAFTAENLSVAQKDTQDFVRKLFNWRKTETAIHQGRLIHFIPENNCYVYFRVFNSGKDGRKVMVIINRNEQSAELDLQRFQEVIKDSKTAREVMSGQAISLKEKLKVNAKTALILELK